MSNIEFIRNAEHVEINLERNAIILNVNDNQVKLNRRHMITRAVAASTPEEVIHHLQGGTFIFDKKDNETSLIEYKGNDYKGFIQSDEFVHRFGNDTTIHSRMNGELSLPEYGLGGDLSLTSGFSWSAFSRNLVTRVHVLRQICSNGMVARSQMFQREVPLYNLYDAHLDIAATQLLEISKRHIKQRLEIMGREHSTIRDVNLVKSHVMNRLKDDSLNNRLQNLNHTLNVDLSEYYHEDALESGIAATLPSTISRYDLWNIITEMNTHTDDNAESTTLALERLATGLMFPKNIVGVVNDTLVSSQTFGSPELAFFG